MTVPPSPTMFGSLFDMFLLWLHQPNVKWVCVNVLPWFMSAITIWSYILTGNKNRKAWIFSFFNQILYLLVNLTVGTYGLIPTSLFLAVLSIRNYTKWLRDDQIAYSKSQQKT